MEKQVEDTIKKCNEALELQKTKFEIEKDFIKKSTKEVKELTIS